MIKSLWEEDVMEAIDYANEIAEKLNTLPHILFKPNYESASSGVTYLTENVDIPSSGFHCIYRQGIPVYVGYSSNYTTTRIGRFCSVVRNKQRDDEDHIGARRYRQAFGEDFEGVSVKVIEYHEGSDISVKISEIASELAIKLNATFNDEVYNKKDFNDE